MTQLMEVSMEDKKYFSHSWSLMTRNKGWIKPILLMALACLVPVVGPLAVLGYAFEWARLSAWGVDSSPKQKGVKIGGCLSSGWRAFVVILVWSLVLGIACAIVGSILTFLLRGIGSAVITIVEFVLGAPIMVAAMHACIYEKIGAGFKFARIFEMIKRDWEGLAKTLLIPLALCAILAALTSLVFSVMIGFALPDIMRLAYEIEYYGDNYTIATLVASILRGVLPGTVLFSYVALVLGSAGSLLFTNSIGLWMSQFDVRSWGGPDEPLPAEANALPPAAATPVEPAAGDPEPASEPATQEAAAPEPSPASAEQPAEASGSEAPQPASASAPVHEPEEAPKAVELPTPGSEEAEQLQSDKGETIVPLVKLRSDDETDQQQ